MPRLVQHIDAIAREKNRDVLFVHFEEYDHEQQENNTARNALLEWLDLQNIEYIPCMGIEGEALISAYAGDIYVDVPFDQESPAFRTLSEYLEDDQGNMKIDGVLFYALSLDIALEVAADRENSDYFDDEIIDEDEAEDKFGDQFGQGFIETPEADLDSFDMPDQKKS